MADWVRELIAVPEREHPRFEAGLSVIGALTPDEVAALLFDRPAPEISATGAGLVVRLTKAA